MGILKKLLAGISLCSITGCSTIQSYEMLSLVGENSSLKDVKRKGWYTHQKSPHFGEWRPALRQYKFKNGEAVVLYPIVIKTKSFDGPPFLPLIPAPQAFCHPENNNLFRFLYTGDQRDIRIEKVEEIKISSDRVNVDYHEDGVLFSLRLDPSVTSGNSLNIHLVCDGELKTFSFERKTYNMFIPLVFPASSAL